MTDLSKKKKYIDTWKLLTFVLIDWPNNNTSKYIFRLKFKLRLNVACVKSFLLKIIKIKIKIAHPKRTEYINPVGTRKFSEALGLQ